ncbi:MAG: glycine cleavage system protein H, partial [Gammaproteobacteria bacterium TMED107]
DVYSPLTGEVTEVNETLLDAPETVNTNPYDNGWFFKVAISDEAELDELMDADAYADHCDDE